MLAFCTQSNGDVVKSTTIVQPTDAARAPSAPGKGRSQEEERVNHVVVVGTLEDLSEIRVCRL